MDTVLIIDCDQGKFWAQLRSLKLHRYKLFRTDEWQTALQSLETESVALVLCNLDSPKFELSALIELENRRADNSIIPILVASEQPSLDHGVVQNCEHVEFCSVMGGFDYLQSRINHHLQQHYSMQQQSRKLAELKILYQVILESASEGIIQYDKTGVIHSANRKALSLLNYNEKQIIGHDVFDLLSTAEDDAADAKQLGSLMLQQQPYVCNRVILNTRKNSTIVAEISGNCIRDIDAKVQSHIMMFQDITVRTLNEERLVKLAKYDVLTGLSNRSKFHDFTEGKIAYCAHNRKKMAVLFIDIDHFKNINDSMGHDAGDELLVGVAERLRFCIRESDILARIGGDEFAITLVEMGNPNQVTRIVRHILEVIRKPFYIQSREVNVSASIGISLFPESGSDLKTLTQTADTAMYQAKIDGRNTYRFFSAEIQNRMMELSSLEDALRKAIANDEFFMHYQPQIDSVTGRVVGLEALIRWQHPDWPKIGPDRFIPVAEECGLLPALGKWVLYSACRQAVKWRTDEHIQFNFPVAVNLSPKQLVSGDFIDLLDKVLRDTGLPPENLVLELTETAVMLNPDVAISTLGKISSAGVTLSVDDFGTGYSSLNYLKKLPIDKLKIDRSFVKDIGIDTNGEAIVKAILALAHSLNLEVVAEGVEEQHHVDFLREYGCEQLQGYFFSKPLCVEKISALLRQEKVKWDGVAADPGKPQAVESEHFKSPFH